MLPGGVNSPVRAFKSVGGQPIIFESVKGSKCYDVDGNEYIDYVGSWGPAIVGHANEEVNAALKAQVDKGTSFGAPCELEVSLHAQSAADALEQGCTSLNILFSSHVAACTPPSTADLTQLFLPVPAVVQTSYSILVTACMRAFLVSHCVVPSIMANVGLIKPSTAPACKSCYHTLCRTSLPE